MTTVLIGGVFDPLHAGHLAYIREARRYAGEGWPLVVVSDSDKHPPLVPLDDRLQLLHALVGEAIALRCGSVAEVIRTERPSVYLKGEEWRGCLPAEEVAACVEVGCRIEYVNCRTNSSSLLLADYQRRVNEQGVRQFEAFVQGQAQPKPWVPVTDYSLEGRRAAEGQHPDLILEVFQPKLILDAGCGHGYLVQFLRERGAQVTGYDLEDGFDLSSPDRVPTAHYDLVICREVLEHLTVKGIRQAVRNLARLSSKYVYVTTRFNPFPAHPYDVLDHDDLDPTHISLLPKELLRSWFIAEGCKSRLDLEAKMDWQNKGRCLVFEV